MVHLDATLAKSEEPGDKGLKEGALGFISSVVVGVASTAPAYSLAATLGFVVIAIGGGLQTPIIAILAFVPMLLISYGYKALNSADPDCGTTFTWATRAFGPKTGWLGGWGIIAADILVMASLAQIAGQYVFLLFNANGIGHNADSGWVLLVGILWIVAMTAICYVGIEISANFQKILLGIELVMLTVLSAVALYKVGAGTCARGPPHTELVLVQPVQRSGPRELHGGADPDALHLLGLGHRGLGQRGDQGPGQDPGSGGRDLDLHPAGHLCRRDRFRAVLCGRRVPRASGSPIRTTPATSCPCWDRPIFGTSGFGSFLSHLLLLMVLSSAAASTQTTILPTARTTLSMAVFKAIPGAFGKIHRRYLTPTVSTLTMGGVSIVLYVVMNYVSNGNSVIEDSVSALGVWIAFYYGLTGFSSAWYYRKTLGESARTLWLRGILPLIGGLILWFAMFWSFWYYWNPVNSYSHFTFPGTNRVIGGVFALDVGTVILGVVLMYVWMAFRPAFFRGEILNRDTPTRVPTDVGVPVGLFGIEPFADAEGHAKNEPTGSE